MVELRARLIGKGRLARSLVGVSLGRGPKWGLVSAMPSGQSYSSSHGGNISTKV